LIVRFVDVGEIVDIHWCFKISVTGKITKKTKNNTSESYNTISAKDETTPHKSLNTNERKQFLHSNS
jgi:hypothetical protein